MNIFILGGDGYIGWPLSYKLALLYPQYNFYIFDNFIRRKLVENIRGASATPILPLEKRIEQFSLHFKQNNLFFYEMDILDEQFKDILIEKSPQTIYHLAQQPSAHYSMKGIDESIFTLRNNEESNLKLLWYIKDYLPDTHLIKLGSFGEYAQCGLDIPEGYFKPTFKSKEAIHFTPFPRESDDVYHITKINDTNFISMACRQWNLKITDVMQATIFGIYLEKYIDFPFLYTRLDYDEFFGTVINRFIIQLLLGFPLTVYGTGNQRTGLMCLDDAVNSLCNTFKEVPQPGEHKVINNLVEKHYCIKELALLIKKVAEELSIKVDITQGDYNPRNENLTQKQEYGIDTSLNIQAQSIDQVIKSTIKLLLPYKSHFIDNIIVPSFNWNKKYATVNQL